MISFKPCILVRMLLLYVVQYIFKGFWASLQSKLERYKLQHLFICFLKIRKKVICHKSSGQGTTKVQTTRETNDLKKKSLKSYTSNISLALKELTKFSGRTWVMAQVESPVSFHKWKVCTALEFRLYFVSYENSSCFHVFIEESCQRSNVALALLRWLLKNKQESQQVHWMFENRSLTQVNWPFIELLTLLGLVNLSSSV